MEYLGLRIGASRGSAVSIRGMGARVDEVLKKVGEGSPNVVDLIETGEIDLVINTPTGSGARADGWEIRRAAVARGIACITTISGGHAAVRAISAARNGEPKVLSLQELHPDRSRVG
jgi:carbamoyl-phosphate synthase large subunit